MLVFLPDNKLAFALHLQYRNMVIIVRASSNNISHLLCFYKKRKYIKLTYMKMSEDGMKNTLMCY